MLCIRAFQPYVTLLMYHLLLQRRMMPTEPCIYSKEVTCEPGAWQCNKPTIQTTSWLLRSVNSYTMHLGFDIWLERCYGIFDVRLLCRQRLRQSGNPERRIPSCSAPFSVVLSSAPRVQSPKSLRMPVLLLILAMSRALLPYAVTCFGSAPPSTSAFAHTSSFVRAARHSGVRPFCPAASTSR